MVLRSRVCVPPADVSNSLAVKLPITVERREEIVVVFLFLFLCFFKLSFLAMFENPPLSIKKRRKKKEEQKNWQKRKKKRGIVYSTIL